MNKKFIDYCVGCGLCEAKGKADCAEDARGYLYPLFGDEAWMRRVCPSGGNQQSWMDFSKIWGRAEKVWYGWSKDDEVRHSASSGGILTETAAYLLERHYIDAVIHTMADPDDPTKTVSCLSCSREELIARSGSRYSISHPLRMCSSLDKSKKYAFIGKPCDVVALRNYMTIEPELEKTIPYIMSFFCMGLPSKDAQDNLIDHLGVDRDRLSSLRYRGEGWPGFTIAKDIEGKIYQTDYNTSWGKILGRDVMKACRFCIDGIGEAADISCGDAWYLTKDMKPDFTESDGRNVIFARTTKGQQLLEEMIRDEAIEVTETTADELKYIQKSQWERRSTMVDRILALKVLGRPAPKYAFKNLRKYAREVNLRRHLSVLKGTASRVLKHKI